jgi:uncharacterized protein (DUF1810 family)
MADPYHFQRFIDAQDGVFEVALDELRAGRKESHWMWFIFPQLAGLGRSPSAQYYAIASLDEARKYLDHPLLGPRLRRAVDTVLPWAGSHSPEEIFGQVDASKLRSSLTLFDRAAPSDIIANALNAFFGGDRDGATLALLTASG